MLFDFQGHSLFFRCQNTALGPHQTIQREGGSPAKRLRIMDSTALKNDTTQQDPTAWFQLKNPGSSEVL